MAWIPDFLNRFFRRSKPPVPPASRRPLIASYFPYGSPQAATYWQLASQRFDCPCTQCRQPDSFIFASWSDDHNVFIHRTAGRRYPA